MQLHLLIDLNLSTLYVLHYIFNIGNVRASPRKARAALAAAGPFYWRVLTPTSLENQFEVTWWILHHGFAAVLDLLCMPPLLGTSSIWARAGLGGLVASLLGGSWSA
jgi:hypothetical protein